jgi:hypothetical protein
MRMVTSSNVGSGVHELQVLTDRPGKVQRNPRSENEGDDPSAVQGQAVPPVCSHSRAFGMFVVGLSA